MHCQHSSHSTIMSHTGTMRGTPKANRTQPAGGAHFSNSPSNIPRPALDSHASHVAQSDAGGSTLSASRAKMSKRDEVRVVNGLYRTHAYRSTGDPTKNRNGPEQEEDSGQPRATYQKGSPRHSSCSQAKPRSPNQAIDHRRRSRAINGSKKGRLCLGYRR